MIIRLRSKKSPNQGKSIIQSGDISKYCNITLNYNRHPEIFEDIKKTLNKYYNLVEESAHKKKATGSITRAFQSIKKQEKSNK